MKSEPDNESEPPQVAGVDNAAPPPEDVQHPVEEPKEGEGEAVQDDDDDDAYRPRVGTSKAIVAALVVVLAVVGSQEPMPTTRRILLALSFVLQLLWLQLVVFSYVIFDKYSSSSSADCPTLVKAWFVVWGTVVLVIFLNCHLFLQTKGPFKMWQLQQRASSSPPIPSQGKGYTYSPDNDEEGEALVGDLSRLEAEEEVCLPNTRYYLTGTVLGIFGTFGAVWSIVGTVLIFESSQRECGDVYSQGKLHVILMWVLCFLTICYQVALRCYLHHHRRRKQQEPYPVTHVLPHPLRAELQ